MADQLRRVCMVSVHGCPLARPGMRSAGGMNVYIREITKALVAKGVCVDIFTRNHAIGGPAVVELSPGARVIHVPAGPVELGKEYLHRYLDEFLEGIKAFCLGEALGYDLVHSHYWLSAHVAHELAAFLRIPHVVTFHTLAEAKGPNAFEQRRLEGEKQSAGRAECLVAFTPGERETLIRHYGAPAKNTFVAPGGVDLERFSPGNKREARKRLGLDPEGRIIMYAGRIEPFKGIELLLLAMAQMDSLDGITLLIVGGEGKWDRERVRLERLTRELDIDRHVRWQGACQQWQLPHNYNAADVCVVPSYHESFGLVALEAMACGVPVVAAPVGGLASLILNGETGWFVRAHNPEGFAECLDKVLGNPEQRLLMADNARKRATEFPWARAAQSLTDVYHEALAKMPWRTPVAPCNGDRLLNEALVPVGDCSEPEP